MELLESLLVNKKNFRILATIYIIVVIIVLVWIWWPESTLDIAKYEQYDETAKNKEMLEYYMRFLESIKQNNDIVALKAYFDYNYLDDNNTTLEEVMERLKSTSTSYVIDTFDVYENGDERIYSVDIPSSAKPLKVNFVEKNYPYNFSITYDTFVSYSDFRYYGKAGNATLIITGTYQDLNYVEYELSVTNDYYDELLLDFLSADNFKLKLKNGNTVPLSLVQSTQDKLVIEKGKTVQAKLVFNIGITEQNSISSLDIRKISNGSSMLTATVSF